ncbi:hypothetical protein GCM10027275_25060 [Rhabdobacter roseus]|uniref:Uncharacterized protein n=1 Tax=Rhabdobacter roseus TaxID=1655419 RepID=A0A840TJR5_9BACT|nr:hypothetical protein [Rhabdobacter roseus]MBB5284446.1 hypothetical protein [Rhabdobacter roseus]
MKKTIFYVDEPKYQELSKVLSSSEISQYERVRGTVFLHSKEYVVHSAISEPPHQGWARLWGHEVVELSQYEGTLMPLRQKDHRCEVDFGRRERGYAGQIVDHGKRQLVMTGQEIEFRSSGTGQQISLF